MPLTPKNWAAFQHYKDRSPAWIKLHRGILDDYEFACLPVASRALAPLLWLLASEYERGEITASSSEIAFRLRMPVAEFREAFTPLLDKGFFTGASGVLANCKHDAIPEREKEEEIQEKIDSEPIGSGAVAPVDYRKELFNEGLKKLATLTGKTPNSCRSLVGRWLSQVQDEAIHVLGWIEEAERNKIADPVGWIEKQLQILHGKRGRSTGSPPRPGSKEDNREKTHHALEQLRDYVRSNADDEGGSGGSRAAHVGVIPFAKPS